MDIFAPEKELLRAFGNRKIRKIENIKVENTSIMIYVLLIAQRQHHFAADIPNKTIAIYPAEVVIRQGNRITQARFTE